MSSTGRPLRPTGVRASSLNRDADRLSARRPRLLLWLLVNFVQDPTSVPERRVDRADGRRRSTALIALGYTLVYGILQLINFAHGDVFALSGLVAFSIITWLGLDTDTSTPVILGGLLSSAPRHDAAVRDGERPDRTRRVQAASPGPAACSVDHRGRGLLHPPEHLSRRLRPQLPHDPGLHPADGRDQHSAASRSNGTSSRSSRS